MSTLRLVKMVVQPTYVLDDGEGLVEKIGEQMVITGAAWPTFPERLESMRVEIERRLNEEDLPARLEREFKEERTDV